ncbi:MAG: hypothetical protein U5K27_18545 [Desulfotignum sp.]|nr:hypothetical protein [Desulfotignum sp.]
MKYQASGDNPAINKRCFLDFLMNHFPEEDSRLLVYFFQNHADAECFSYKDLQLPQEEAQELLMLCFDQRVILPEKTRKGPAWEDRILTFDETAVFQIPPVVRQITRMAGSRESLQTNFLLASIFEELPSSDISDMAQLLTTIMANSRNRMFEAGLLDLYHKQIDARISLHDMLDLFVISGVMSPCPALSLKTGLAWYEISPVCYWWPTSMT